MNRKTTARILESGHKGSETRSKRSILEIKDMYFVVITRTVGNGMHLGEGHVDPEKPVTPHVEIEEEIIK